MTTVFVFGHQNPDTDAITSAISFAYLQQQLGVDAEAVALGEINEETQFALDYFNVKAPRIVTSAKSEVSEVILVDHNEFQQSISDIEELEILGVVDHHRIDNFRTANPLFYRAEPVGCTNTIIAKLFKENGVEIPSDIAGLMLSAIISDTLLFKSPTCTNEDVIIATELAELAKVDRQVYGLELLKAGTNLSDKSAEELIDLDAKSFPLADKNFRIAQVNTVDLAEFMAIKIELEKAMLAANKENGYDLFLLVVTNILDSNSMIFVVGDPKEKIEEAFDIKLEEGTAILKGVVSRKKQIVPPLTEVFK